MDDSNILYYIVVGAIYVISRILKKRKKNQEPVQTESPVADTVIESPNKKPSSFEDLFKELTGDDFSPKTSKPELIEETPIQPEIIPTHTNYDQELVDIVPPKPVERDKPLFERDEHFKMRKEEEASEENHLVHDLFKNADDVKRAIVLKEILDRKY